MNIIPLINGINYDWAGVNFLVAGVPVSTIRSITYEAKRNFSNTMGVGPEPISRGSGNREYTGGSFEMLLDEFKTIITASPNNDPTLNPMFEISVIWGDSPFNPNSTTDTLLNCSIMTNARALKQGETAIWVKVDFIFAGLNS